MKGNKCSQMKGVVHAGYAQIFFLYKTSNPFVKDTNSYFICVKNGKCTVKYQFGVFDRNRLLYTSCIKPTCSMGIRIRYQQVSSGMYSGITSEGISKSKCTYYLSVPQIKERGSSGGNQRPYSDCAENVALAL